MKGKIMELCGEHKDIKARIRKLRQDKKLSVKAMRARKEYKAK